MDVLISNPERKKERTDHDANDREVYVAGLSRSTTKADLEVLFKIVRHLATVSRGDTDIPSLLVWSSKRDSAGRRWAW